MLDGGNIVKFDWLEWICVGYLLAVLTLIANGLAEINRTLRKRNDDR
jgi:hypothetical protein